MTPVIQREIFIAFSAQPLWIRVLKYLVLGAIATLIYKKYSWKGIAYLIIIVLIAGTSLHFFLRSKTDGWTKSWGPVTIPVTESK
jgi:hypothetical protein